MAMNICWRRVCHVAVLILKKKLYFVKISFPDVSFLPLLAINKEHESC